MRKYHNVEEIREGFIKKGWNEDTTFSILSVEEAKQKGYLGMLEEMANGQIFFKMNVSGNIYNDFGEIEMFNIPCINTK